MKYSEYVNKKLFNIKHSFDGEDGKPPEEHVIEKAGYVTKELEKLSGVGHFVQLPLPGKGGIVFETSNNHDYEFILDIRNDGTMDIVDTYMEVRDNTSDGTTVFCNIEEIVEYFKNRQNEINKKQK